jgi:hypothetical protein
VRFGRQLTLTQDGNLTRSEEKVFVEYETKKQITLYTETVKIKDDKDMLAEWLKLLDRYRNNEIDLPGIQLLRDKHTGSLRLEKTWTPTDLH